MKLMCWCTSCLEIHKKPKKLLFFGGGGKVEALPSIGKFQALYRWVASQHLRAAIKATFSPVDGVEILQNTRKCMKPCKSWDVYHITTGDRRISCIDSKDFAK